MRIMMTEEEKIFYYQYTFFLAEKGRGSVAPNPEVGSVVVQNTKNNTKIIGEGYHQKFGGHHAEVHAILDAEKKGFSVEGASLFVSLEPCCHRSSQKKTPPCVDLILQKKIAKVFVFHLDPNPEVSGKGIQKLRDAGVQVFVFSEENIFEKNEDKQNKNQKILWKNYKHFYEIFAFWISESGEKKPYCTLKLAQQKNASGDFFLGKKGESTPITGEECRKFTLEQRDRHQAIVVGSETVLVDNPTLSGKKTEPLRIILDRNFRVGKFLLESNKNTHTPQCSAQKINVLRDDNFLLIISEKTENVLKKKYPFLLKQYGKNFLLCSFLKGSEVFDLRVLRKKIAEKNISSVFIEGGGETARNFVSQEQVQTYIQYTSSKTFSSFSSRELGDDLVRGVSEQERKKIFPDETLSEHFFLGEDEVEIFRGV